MVLYHHLILRHQGGKKKRNICTYICIYTKWTRISFTI